MTGIGQKFGHGLALALCFGAISACQSAVETTEQPAPDSATTTEQPTIDEPATDSPDEASGSTDSSASTTATPPGTAGAVETAAFEPEPIPPLPAECADPKTQMAMTTCAAAEYERADTQLNNVYRAVKTSVSANQADQLIVAEQAWLDFRDINCDFVASQYAGGSIEPMIYNDCMTRLTSDRTAVLEQTVTTTASLEVVDRELNAAYQELQTYLISAEQEHLTDAQLAWLDYRDAHCTFAGGNTNACLAQLTDIRTKQLEVQLESRSL